MGLETRYFLRIGKIPLTKVIDFPHRTISSIINLANLSDKAVPSTRFPLKKCHIAKNPGNHQKVDILMILLYFGPVSELSQSEGGSKRNIF